MIKELTSLRFIFMCMIYLYHMGYYPTGGPLGVAFFFVLSGFVLTLGYKDRILKRELNYHQFITRRLIRLFPLHWLCFVAACILMLLMGDTPFSPISRALANVALLQSWIPISSYYYSYNSVSWFLSDLLFFVLVYPFILRLLWWFYEKRRRFIVLLTTLILIPSFLFILTPENKIAYFFYVFPPTRLIDFVLGICSAFVFLYLKTKTSWVDEHKSVLQICMYCCIPVLVMVSILAPGENTLFSLFFSPLLCVLIILTSLERIGNNTVFSWSPFVFLGSFSFEFYLLHELCIRFVEHYNYLGITISKVVLLVNFLIAMVLSILCHYAFVKPVTNRLNNIIH